MAGLERNLSTMDRVIRTILGLVMIYVAYFESEVLSSLSLSIILGVIGIFFIIIAIISVCPLYNLIGLSTYRKN